MLILTSNNYYCGLPNCNFLLSLFINWNSTLGKSCSFCTSYCLFNYLVISDGLMDSYLMLWVIIHYYHSILLLRLSKFQSLAALQVGFCGLSSAIANFETPPCSLVVGEISGSPYTFFAPSLDQLFSSKPWSLLL